MLADWPLVFEVSHEILCRLCKSYQVDKMKKSFTQDLRHLRHEFFVKLI